MSSELLLWKRPVATGGILLLIDTTIIWYVMDYSFVGLFSKLGVLAAFGGLIAKLLKLVDTSAEADALVPKEVAENLVTVFCEFVNQQAAAAKDVVLWKDQTATVKALVMLYFLSVLPDIFNLTVLIFLGVNLLFAVPVLLSTQKELVDKSVMPHLKKIQAISGDAWNKIPRVSHVKKIE